MGYQKRNPDDYAFLEAEQRQEWDIDKEMDRQMRDRVREINKITIENEGGIEKAEREYKEYRGKLENIQTVQKQLYKAILFQGLDTKYFFNEK